MYIFLERFSFENMMSTTLTTRNVSNSAILFCQAWVFFILTGNGQYPLGRPFVTYSLIARTPFCLRIEFSGTTPRTLVNG